MEQEISGWFAGRLPDDWFEAAPEVTADRDEILVVGRLGDVDLGADASEEAAGAARLARIKRFREDTREARMRIADEAERLFGRKVAWGAECGGVRRVFTNMAIPVMTRLRLRERAVLDTLIDAGVARSRSEALAWCVRLVGRNESEWIDSLREALAGVEKARAQGPAA
ncbi:MAG TPA: hypothetical protein VG318_10640 [Actinomycetota bacterium]|nr:hypothetical protein [Actinomycetota bacterium]